MIRKLRTGILDVNLYYNIEFICMQGDDLILELNCFDKCVQADLSNYNVRLKAMKADNIPLVQNSNISIINNVVTINCSNQLTTTKGTVKCELQFIEKDTLKHKSSFYICIEIVPSVFFQNGTISQATCTLLQEMDNKLDKLENISNILEDTISTGNITNDKLNTTINTATTTDNTLNTTIANAGQSKNNLDSSISTGNTAKSNLDKSIDSANNIKSVLDSANATASKNKENLDSANTQASKNIDALNALGDATDLAKKVQNNTTQLNDIANIKLVKDIPSTDYVQGQLIGGDFIRTRQIINYADFFRKLRKKESVQICCMGDSLTNGQDTVSADVRPVASDPTRVSGEATSSQTIASVTYPEALRNRLRTVYGEQVNVINRGYSGDWVKAGYTRYNTKHDSDLTIIMYGTNDSRASWVPEDIRGNLEEYIYWYEQLIVREILWGKAVIIMKPPKLLSASDLDVDIFRNALDALGEKYCIPVIDTEEFTANYSNSIYCDTTHFNGMGYSIFASRVAALLIGEGAFNPKKIMDGSKLLTRPTIDNIVYMGGAYFDTDTGVDTPNENNSAKGIVARIPAGGSIIYSFYVEEDDLVALPYAYLVSGGTFKLELDFGVTQAQNSLDGALYLDRTTPDSTVQYTSYSNAGLYNKSKILDDNLSILRIVGKGWHTLRISSVDNTTVFSGLEFIAYEDVKQYKDINKLNTKQGFYYGLTHSSYSATPEVVTETRIKVSTLLEHLGRTDILTTNEYWKHPPFKITVFNYGQSIIEYMFCCGSLGDGANSFFCGEISRKNIATTPTERTISNIIFDSITQEIVITWDGANRVANFVIGLAF